MNNWRLLLLAVVAVLQPIGSFTEPNLIDGRQECCDHRSNSFTQETTLYGNSRKTTPEDRRLNSQEDIREDQRSSDTRNGLIRFRDRLTVDRTERRVSPESAVRFGTETRFARDQERRQRSAISRQSREDASRRIHERISRDSLSRYERDALDSRRIRMSNGDTRIGRVTNEQVYDKSIGSYDTRSVRDSEYSRRVSVNTETVADRRGRGNVARDESHRDSRISTFGVENRLQHDNNRERRNLDRRLRDNTEDNRRSRSLESRINSVERDNQRTSFRTMSERVDERRRDQKKESRDSTVATLRESSERIFADRRRESSDTVERVDQSRRNIRDYRSDERIEVQRQHRDESKISRERSSERRESRLNAEQRLVRESRVKDANEQFERTVRSNGRREPTRDTVRASRDITNERRQDARASRVSETTNNVLRTLRSDDTRNEPQQPLTRSLDRVRSDEREFNARIGERNIRNERSVKYRRDVRSEERLDEQREQRYGTRMSRDRQITMLRESRDNAERRQEIRSTVSPTRFEVNVRSERESRLRERDNRKRAVSREQTLKRMARDTEHRHADQLSRTSRLTERAFSEERVSRIREERLDLQQEAHNNNKARSVVMQRLTRDVSAAQRRSDTRRIESNTRIQRARTLEDIRADRRAVTLRDESRVLSDRIATRRLSRERIETREARRATTDSLIDARNDIRNRGVRMTEKSESRRQQVDSRSQDRVLRRQARDILAARSFERRSRETGSREVRNDARELRTVELQPNRYNFAMERVDRTTNRVSRDIRIETKLRSSDIVLAKDSADNRREVRDTRYRIFESQVREIDVVDDTSDSQNAMSWKMVFYTLQGAYLCGLLMQMLTEKSNKGKSRNIVAWWSSASKDLVKVD